MYYMKSIVFSFYMMSYFTLYTPQNTVSEVNIESLLIEQSSVIAMYRVKQQGEYQVR